jgi:hypothetical protein
MPGPASGAHEQRRTRGPAPGRQRSARPPSSASARAAPATWPSSGRGAIGEQHGRSISTTAPRRALGEPEHPNEPGRAALRLDALDLDHGAQLEAPAIVEPWAHEPHGPVIGEQRHAGKRSPSARRSLDARDHASEPASVEHLGKPH